MPALSGATCDIAPVVLQGSNVGLSICGNAVPVDKIDLKRTAKKTDVTSTASLQGGVIWEEYAPGVSGGTLSFDSHWRAAGQLVNPPNVIPGQIYAIKAYVRKAGTNGANDLGLYYALNLFIDDYSLTLDPKSGVVTWKVSGTATGPITDPTGT